MYKKVLSKAPNGTTYIYLDEPYYDKEKGRSSHHRVCIGKIADDGHERYNGRYSALVSDGALIAPKVALEGERLVLEKLIKGLGLRQTLEEVFGMDTADKILALSSYLATGKKPLTEAASWLTMRGYGYEPDREELRSLLSSLDGAAIARFHSLWQNRKGKGKACLYILRPVSEYGTAGTYVERGMQEGRNTLELGLFASTLPLSLHELPPDTDAGGLYSWLSSDPVISEETEITVIADKRFNNGRNLKALEERGMSYTLPMLDGERLLRKHMKELSGRSSILVDKDNEQIHAVTVPQDGTHGKTWVHLFYDSLRKERENEAFMKRYERCKAGKATKADEDFAKLYLDDPDAVKDFMEGTSACWALVSNSERFARNALCQYRTRNDLELCFDDLRNSQDSGRGGLDDILSGKLFLSFLSLILVSELKGKVSRTGLKRKYHYNWKDVLDAVSTYSSVHLPGSPVPLYTALTEAQRIIFEAFKII